MTNVRLGVAVVVWAIVVGALLGSDAEPQILLLAGLVSITVATGFVAIDLVRAARPVAWARAPQPHVTRIDDDTVTALTGQIRSARRPWSTLRATLVSLIDERLLDRHGIDRTDQPDAALAALGPGLVALIEQPRTRLSDPEDLHRLLDEIESI